jgi:hypothetical protein
MNTLARPSGAVVDSSLPAKLSLDALGLLLLSLPAPALPPRLPDLPRELDGNSPTFAWQFNPPFQSRSFANLPIQKPSLPPSLRVLFPYLGQRQA